MFGEHRLERVVYGTREGQRIVAAPLDGRLGLPEGKYSYLLEGWSQELATQLPFEEVSGTLERFLAQEVPVDSLERHSRRLGQSVAGFWQQLLPPPPEKEGPLLVVSSDHKGIPMRRPVEAGEKPARAVKQPAEGGLRTGTKKMAQLGAVYSIEPFVRTPEQVVEALFQEGTETPGPDQQPPGRPRPLYKRLRGVLRRGEDGTCAEQTQELFGWLEQEVNARNPRGEKTVLVLMDGERDLWDNGAAAHLPPGYVPILDLIHVLDYLWEAAGLFFKPTSDSARRFVRERVLRILRGELHPVLKGLRIMAGQHALKPDFRARLEQICAYLEHNAARMDYGRYLAAGYPICSGVIEGACRNVVCDRMERSGMRWVMPGAQAMLALRSLQLSDLWDDFMSFHIAQERRRLYPDIAANEPLFLDRVA